MANAVVSVQGGPVALHTLLGQAPARIPTGGKIRPGIMVLTRKAAEHPEAKAIYRQGVDEGRSFEEIERVMNVNFYGTLNMDKVFLPLLKQRPEAVLLNVSSMGGLVPVPGQGAYGASKAAVKLLTETLYAELQGTSVSVIEVFPGGVGTDIAGNSGVDVAALAAKAGKTPKVTSVEDAGRIIVEAVADGRFRVLIGNDAKMLDRLSRIAPRRAITTVADQMKKLLG